jgi:hypothetical protein
LPVLVSPRLYTSSRRERWFCEAAPSVHRQPWVELVGRRPGIALAGKSRTGWGRGTYRSATERDKRRRNSWKRGSHPSSRSGCASAGQRLSGCDPPAGAASACAGGGGTAHDRRDVPPAADFMAVGRPHAATERGRVAAQSASTDSIGRGRRPAVGLIGPLVPPDGYAAAVASQWRRRWGTRSAARSSGKNSLAPAISTISVTPGMVSRSQRAHDRSKN